MSRSNDLAALTVQHHLDHSHTVDYPGVEYIRYDPESGELSVDENGGNLGGSCIVPNTIKGISWVKTRGVWSINVSGSERRTLHLHIAVCNLKYGREAIAHSEKNEPVRHLCGNDRCVNTDHLAFGTQSQNRFDTKVHRNAELIWKWKSGDTADLDQLYKELADRQERIDKLKRELDQLVKDQLATRRWIDFFMKRTEAQGDLFD